MKHRKYEFSSCFIDKSCASAKGTFVRVLSRNLIFWMAFIALSPLLGASVLDFMRFMMGVLALFVKAHLVTLEN